MLDIRFRQIGEITKVWSATEFDGEKDLAELEILKRISSQLAVIRVESL